ncbi:MAG: hypothetical protein FWB91_08120 [Defluviitaleaceae bacterium]|nr:hypothetical protein [Defluviitaleaceae bacterium]
MQNCKKYKAKASAMQDHHRQPKGECKGCVYFSRQNCRAHTPPEGGFTA